MSGSREPPGSQPTQQARIRYRRKDNVLTACISCRQMKMKCEGGENPPCVRCRKARRECRPQTLSRRGTIPESVIPPLMNSNTTFEQQAQDSISVSSPNWYAMVSSNGSQRNQSFGPPLTLPSIYSSPPMTIISSSQANTEDGLESRALLLSTPASLSQNSPRDFLIPLSDLRDMTELQVYYSLELYSQLISARRFCQKILPFLPAFLVTEYSQDFDLLITACLPLAYCMCFIIARFLPGGKAIRDILLPEVLLVTKGKPISSGHRLDNLATLKALVLLSHHSNIKSMSTLHEGDSDYDDLSFWPLKYQTEMYALRLNLHKSAQSLKEDLATSATPGVEKYQLYLFWLQIFVNSHYSSILYGTPPTLRIDASIRAAPILLRDVCTHPQTRLVGEVELTMIWVDISIHHPDFGEWWSQPDPSIDNDEAETALLEVDRALDAWYDRWAEYIGVTPSCFKKYKRTIKKKQIEGDERGAILDCIGRFTRFGVATLGVRQLKNSPEGLSPSQKEQVRRCNLRAVQVLDWPLKLSPMKKDQLRYIADHAWVMTLFCCHFIVSVCGTFRSIISDTTSSLQKTSEIVQLVMILAVDQDRMPYKEASNILKRVRALQESFLQETQRQDAELPGGMSDILNGSGSGMLQLQWMNEYHAHDLDGLGPWWDFSGVFETDVLTEIESSDFNV